jgi:flavin-dependent dehydrogenase
MIAPTLSMGEAAERAWDVVVVGAGPAGALAARELARRHLTVLLVDKDRFPRWKVCGACLNGRALHTLARVGLGDLTTAHAAVPLTGFHMATPGAASSLALPRGVALSRRAFDAALIEAAITAGSAFLPAVRATPGPVTSDTRMVRLTHGGTEVSIAARVLVAADGLAGALAGGKATIAPHSHVGAGTQVEDAPSFYQPGIIFMACAGPGYVGLVRQEDGRLDVAAAFAPQALPGVGPGRLAEEALRAVGWPAIPGLAGLTWRGTPLLTRRAESLASERLFVVGDAAGYVEPFTGEGMAWALASAVAVAPLAAAAVTDWRPQLAHAWGQRYLRTVRARQIACRAAAGLLRSPTCTQMIVRLLRQAPWVAGPVVRFLNRPLPVTTGRSP